MSVIEGTEIPIEIFNGLVTNIDPRSLPPGVSPDCADNAFKPGTPGTVQTRPGLTTIFDSGFSGGYTYMATYIDQDQNNRNLYLASNGIFYEEFPMGTFTQHGAYTAGAFAKSDTAFGSEFIAFSDGKFGLQNPRRYIGLGSSVTADRVSQIGPAVAPTASDFISAFNINSSLGVVPFSYGIAAISQVGYVATAVFFATLDPNTRVGDTVKVSGVTPSGYNGTFPISNVSFSSNSISYILPVSGLASAGPAGTAGTSIVAVHVGTPPNVNLPVNGVVALAGVTNATYDGTYTVRSVPAGDTFIVNIPAAAGVANSANGTATSVGLISPGIHWLSVIFITRNGYFTFPAPPSSYTAGGNLSALVSNIPLGPANVIARLLIFTASGGANFFFSQSNQIGISSMLIPDNTTTTWIGSFTDLALNSSQSADLLFDRIELPEVCGMLQYGDRIFAWGGRNHIENFVGMSSFAGGVLTPGGYPLGWSIDPVSGGGASTIQFDCGFEYIIGNSVSGPQGMIFQNAYQDYLGVSILSPSTRYSVRAILAKTGAIAGNFTVDLFSSSTSTVYATAVKDLSTLTGTNSEYIFDFGADTPAVIPTDLVLRVYSNYVGTSLNNTLVVTVQLFPKYDPFLPSVLFASNAADPEAFQGTTGFLNVNENDGRRLVSCFIIRDRMYQLKSIGGMFVTSTDPNNEPSGWTVDTISRRVGAETINCVGTHVGDTGEDWVFIINREGLYIFWSSEPPKCSQEIQPTWEQINKDYMHTMWIAVDTARRRVLIGAPIGNVTSPNKILQMDYQSVGATAETVASGAPVAPNYQGQVKAHTTARKWSPWNISAPSGGLIERDDGQAHVFIGKSPISELDESALTDNGVAIPGGGYYVTSFYPSDEQAQTMQFKGNNVFLRYMTCAVQGIGNFEIETFGPNFIDSSITPVAGAPNLVLSNASSNDLQTFIEFTAPVISNKFLASDPSSPWWSLSNVMMYIGQDPVSVLREVN